MPGTRDRFSEARANQGCYAALDGAPRVQLSEFETAIVLFDAAWRKMVKVWLLLACVLLLAIALFVLRASFDVVLSD
jgi:hypothetical protein